MVVPGEEHERLPEGRALPPKEAQGCPVPSWSQICCPEYSSLQLELVFIYRIVRSLAIRHRQQAMGGNAFNLLLPDASFPRMPPTFYLALKAHLTPILQRFYVQVATPREAPEKIDYGDLDFVVYGQRGAEAHEELKTALGASYSIPTEGIRGMHHFAIPLATSDLRDVASSIDKAAFFQVDVSVCVNPEEWDRVVFFTSYGDLGMILSSVARSVDLSLGSNGLKVRCSCSNQSASEMHAYLSPSFSTHSRLRRPRRFAYLHPSPVFWLFSDCL